MRTWMILGLFLLGSFSYAQEIDGLTYFFAADSDDQIEVFLNYTEKHQQTNICCKALHGTALTMSASFGYNPVSKLERFSKGKKVLQETLSANNGDPCAHFCRLAVQIKAPGFLNYNEHIGADTVMIIDSLENGWLKDQPDLRIQVITFLKAELDLTPDRLARLNRL